MSNNLIKKPLTITINENTASLNEPMYFYQEDRWIDFEFTIADVKYKFNEYSGNILIESSASYAVIKVLKPNGDKFMTDKLPIQNNKVILSITDEFADECEECGIHTMQIHLYDDERNDATGKKIQGRVTIPPVNFEVYEPIFHDDKSIATVSCVRADDE